VAIMRGKLAKAPVLLGTATPSVESYFNAQAGRYGLIVLTKRVEDRPLPTVKIVDMRREAETYGKLFNFSRSLIDAVQKRLNREEQIILFLNRRGYAPLVLCPSCGYVLSCSECDQALTYHRTKEQLLCHLCDTHHAVPQRCPKCDKAKLHRLGVGTQRIEAHLTKLFSQAKIQRMDADSTRLKDAHRRILEIFHKGEIQILVGTQMIAKGLDFPNVTLVGVMSADVAMSLPDFRMGEHTFQLLTQVAGRAGRGSKSGEVVVQTFTPFHPIIRAAVDQDYLKFYAAEIAYRRQLGYPPFTRLVSILIQGKSETKIVQIARKMAVQLKKDLNQSNRIFGPQPAPISKIKGHFRWQMILFYPRGKSIHKNLKEVLSFFREEKGIKISIDVDPVSLI
jgi:primosomal protein N' (replication factor Y)